MPINENTYTYSPLDRVIWDTPAEDAILNEIRRLNLDKVFIVASSTISKKTKEISKIKNILGNKFVESFISCIAHSPLENVIDVENFVILTKYSGIFKSSFSSSK